MHSGLSSINRMPVITMMSAFTHYQADDCLRLQVRIGLREPLPVCRQSANLHLQKRNRRACKFPTGLGVRTDDSPRNTKRAGDPKSNIGAVRCVSELDRTGDGDADNARENRASISQQEVDEVTRVTERWVRDFVVSLNLCPFAEGVLQERSHRVVVSTATEEREVWEQVWEEIGTLRAAEPSDIETTLVVLPRFASDEFLRFHELSREMEDAVEGDDDLVDEVMMAFFHPLHQWGDSGVGCASADDAVNYDKRAPYPVINLLRAPHVDEYVEQGRTQGILERNSKTLRRLGNVGVGQLFKSLFQTSERE